MQNNKDGWVVIRMRVGYGIIEQRIGVDPRVYGENLFWMRSFSKSLGRSPRIRGKLPEGDLDVQIPRSIPAYTGKTPKSASPPPSDKVDPRVYGENLNVNKTISCHRGRSPRIRGKHEIEPGDEPVERSIPAYTGKTLLIREVIMWL